MKRLLLLIVILSLPAYLKTVSAQCDDNTNMAILNVDIVALLDIYGGNAASRSYIENAIFAVIDMDKFSYSDILRFINHIDENTTIGKYLIEIKGAKELEIIRSVERMTAEQIMDYVTENPSHKSFVASYITNMVAANLDSLNYYELCYIDESLPLVDSQLIEAERQKRKDELLAIVCENINELCMYEKQAIEQLCYKLECRALKFLYDGYETVASSYAQIILVPETPNDAVAQYRTIVSGCLSSNKLQVEMQNEANGYCEIINNTRKEFLSYTQKNQYPQLKLSIPLIKFDYSVSANSFYSLQEVRNNVNNSRSNSGWVSSAVKLLGGEFWGMLVDAGREVHDSSKGEKLANAEYECRQDYMLEVYSSIEKGVAKQNRNITSRIKKELEKNQKEFIKYVQK